VRERVRTRTRTNGRAAIKRGRWSMVAEAQRVVAEAKREREILKLREQGDRWFGPSGLVKPKITLT
jgi:hypothetical protein